MLDLGNELDYSGMKWNVTVGTGKLGYPPYDSLLLGALSSITSLHAATDLKPIIFVQGLGLLDFGCTTWGDGFVSETSKLGTYIVRPNDGPNRFLGQAEPLQVVLSPHLYCASVAGRGLDACTKDQFVHGYDRSWGGKSLGPGYKTTKTFAVIWDEFGAALNTTGLFPPGDFQCMDTMKEYMGTKTYSFTDARYAAAYGVTSHAPPVGWFWWCWNVNSRDTGGILDSEWYGIEWGKINYLMQSAFGVNPWWLTLG